MADPSGVRRTSKVVPLHSDRTMKSYLVLDSELQSISRLSTWATFFWSAMFTCGSLAFGLWSDLFIEGSPSPDAVKQLPALQGAFVAGALLFFALAVWATLSKRSEIDRIKSESS